MFLDILNYNYGLVSQEKNTKKFSQNALHEISINNAAMCFSICFVKTVLLCCCSIQTYTCMLCTFTFVTHCRTLSAFLEKQSTLYRWVYK